VLISGFMRRAILIALVASTPFAAVAQEGDPESEIDRGMSLLERGTELIIEGLLAEIGPEIEALLGTIDELRGYHPPEMLPNGDIIIRRRQPDAVPEAAPDVEEPDADTGDVEL